MDQPDKPEIKRTKSKEYKPSDIPQNIREEHHRICVLGAERSGKTALLYRFIHKGFQDNVDKPTVQSTQLATISVNNVKCTLEILDTGGSANVYEAKKDKWIEWGEGFVLCYDITSRATFDFISSVKRHIEKKRKVEETPIILVATNTDKEIRRKVPKTFGEKLSKAFNCPFIEVSSSTGEHVDTVFYTLARDLTTSKHTKFDNPIFRHVQKSNSSEAVQSGLGSTPPTNDNSFLRNSPKNSVDRNSIDLSSDASDSDSVHSKHGSGLHQNLSDSSNKPKKPINKSRSVEGDNEMKPPTKVNTLRRFTNKLLGKTSKQDSSDHMSGKCSARNFN